MSESQNLGGRWRGVATIGALILLLAFLVGLIVYQYEEKIGGLAYILGEAIATILVIGLIAWGAYRGWLKLAGAGVVIPALARGKIHGTQLPLPHAIVDARLESPLLLLVAHLEPIFD